ncbi:hypothetical protein [Denitromonas sp.]|uniref:hypothetical protein n=1 Tax=Denitromonas sp. TaxID=2734609 RepID=UPI002AFE2ADE|nr:hypothetical protein [Denitromonas sp.]
MLRLFVVGAFALIGGLCFLRLWSAIIIGASTLAALYGLLLPPILPRWPAIVILSVAIVGGLYWERAAAARAHHR